MNLLVEKLNKMRLLGMSKGVQEQEESGLYKDLSFEERLSMLIDREITYREDRQLKILLKKAKFRYSGACIEEIDYKASRGISKSLFLELSANKWIKDKRNIILTGSTGTGKTYIACALGNSACRDGFKTLYFRIPRLLQEMKIGKVEGSYIKLLDRMSKVDLLIIDDWGLSVLNDIERRDFLEIIEDRHNVRSTIIATQFPVEKWHEIIGDPTIADAICDRLIHNAYHLKLSGESMRKVS